MFTGLSEFMKTDGQIGLSFVAVILLIGAWKKSSWTALGSILVFWGVIMSVINGTQILSTIGKILRFFGIETGL